MHMSSSTIALQRLIRILRSRYSVFDNLWQRYPDNIFVIRCEMDGSFIVEAVNHALEQIMGQSSELLSGRPITDIVPPDYVDAVIGHYRDCMTARCPISYEEAGNGPGEPPKYWLTMMVPAIGATGRVEYILGISRDVTVIREAEEVLRRSNDELERLVQERTAELETANARLVEMAARDGLTGVYSRHHFFELGFREFTLSFRNVRPMSIMMLDIDHFKGVNEKHGQRAGDHVLQQLAALFGRSLRTTDLVGRYGGEEFVVLLCDTDAHRAQSIAYRLNLEVANSMLCWQDCHFHVTLSIGLAHYDPVQDISLEALIQRAENALLTAKAAGRNRLEISMSSF